MLFGFVRLDSYPTDTLCHENISTVYFNNVYTKRGIINYKSSKTCNLPLSALEQSIVP